jgi:predicted aspartyl protease
MPAECLHSHGMTLPLVVQSARPVMEAAVNGQAVRLLLDTGASTTLLRRSTAERLQLPPSLSRTPSIIGLGGRSQTPMVSVSSLQAGPLQFTGIQLATIADEAAPGLRPVAYDGWLGVDLLGYGDVDLNLPQQEVTLYPASACQASKPLWNSGYSILRGARHPSGKVMVEVIINDKPLQALLDSGATASAISAAAAKQLGFIPGSNTRRLTVTGFGSQVPQGHIHRFQSIRIGEETTQNPVLGVVETLPGADVLIGMNFLRGRRIWISYPTASVFIAHRQEPSTPNAPRENRDGKPPG